MVNWTIYIALMIFAWIFILVFFLAIFRVNKRSDEAIHRHYASSQEALGRTLCQCEKTYIELGTDRTRQNGYVHTKTICYPEREEI